MGESCLRIGNTASPAADGKRYDWTLYVRGAVEHLDSVTIKLHPTFKDPVKGLTAPPFEFSANGWGTFEVAVLLRWRDGSSLRTSWPLQFAAPDRFRELAVPQSVAQEHSVPAEPVPQEPHRDLLGNRGSEDCDSPDEAEAPVEAAPEEPDAAPEEPELLRAASAGSTDEDRERRAVREKLMGTGFLQHGHELFMHGRAYEGPRAAPKVTWRSRQAPRQDHAAPAWLTATEFEDEEAVKEVKVQMLARLLRASRKTVAYTGAGISAAVIGQAARSGQNKVGWKGNTRSAPPTFTHHALGWLGRRGLLHGWVQQNHDGLPQKAGFPQERINEIHGSWYDPGNPVVKYSGTLHERSYPWMREDAATADLCLVLGTSLGGLNADQVATSTAERSLHPSAPPPGVLAPGAWVKSRPPGRTAVYKGLVVAVRGGCPAVRFQRTSAAADSDSEEEDSNLGEEVALPKEHPYALLPHAGGGLGTVMINLQQSPHDGKMTLRLFGKSDDLLKGLLLALGFSLEIVRPPKWPTTSRALVPYDADGRRCEARKMWLDLRPGQEVRLTLGHNIQGAQQPQYMHIGAKKAVKLEGGVTRQPGVGNGVVVSRSAETASFLLNIEGAQMHLGVWWLESAMRAGVDVLPVVNRKPQFQ